MSLVPFVLGLLLVLSACGSEVRTRPVSAGLQAPPGSAAPELLRFTQDATVTLATGYERKIWAGSQWRLVGRIPQGGVYQPVDGIFSVEGAHVHEAYLVVTGRTLVGFYLPVERAFAPLTPAMTLPVEK